MNFKDSRFLIDSYKSRGYQIRFPGGTSWNGDINAIIAIINFDQYKQLYFVVVPYDPDSRIVNKKNHKRETKDKLAIRKIGQETGLFAETCNLKLLLKTFVPNNRYKSKDFVHIKYSFLLEKFNGNLSNYDNSSFLSRETGTPFFVPAILLAREIYFKHLTTFEEAINYLSSRLTAENLFFINREIKKRKAQD